MKKLRPVNHPERALLVGVRLPRRFQGSTDDSLDELDALARSAGAEVLGRREQTRERPDPATLIGRGKAEELHREAEALGADLLLFDHDLTPTQLRNLSTGGDIRVLDRTQLILDIFARRARTREGQLQVEMAQLNYLLPRLTGKGIELSRLGGGIGTRGPGETQLEADRRRIRRRIAALKEELEAVRRRRAQQRQARRGTPTLALVGYTNAGKSTLFNALTDSRVEVSSKPFATLDPTLRALELPSGRRVLLSDTVGFIRNLPHGLVAAFHATLEEVEQAAMILHVSDISSPHHREHDDEVVKVLEELSAGDTLRLMVFNKIDRLSAAERRGLKNSSRAVFISALTGDGLPELLHQIDEQLPNDRLVRRTLRFSASDGRPRALVHEFGRVLSEQFRDGVVWMEVELPESVASRVREFTLQPHSPTSR
ncbi:MAG TPA: GTPase HflX [Candidatus Xenobia bacterium]|nr:GTPase HflX [Candidatus Xenobia bacterium]